MTLCHADGYGYEVNLSSFTPRAFVHVYVNAIYVMICVLERCVSDVDPSSFLSGLWN